MKKILTILATTATMFAFGDLPTGTSFEALTEGPVSVGDIVTKDDTGNQDGQYKYWYSTATEADELGAITNDVASGVSRPDLFANQNQANTKSLQIDTSAPLVRTALPNSSGVQPVAIGDGIYLDTLVKFTAADEAFAEDLTGGDKIAIEYVEHEAEEGDVGYTNFVIRAGFVGGQEIVQTNYFAAVPAGFNKDEWHRLTVRTIANVGDGNVGFVIYLDGNMEKTLEYSKDVDAGFGELNALAQTFYNSDRRALFPSAVNSGDNKLTISSVAFSGNGFIDDVSFTATKPTFINEAILVTIAWDEHVTGMTINNTVLTPEQVAEKSWTGEPVDGSVVAIPTFAAGYVAGAPVLPEGATYNSETKTFGNLASGMTCTIKSMFPYYEVDGVSFDDLDAAIEAAEAGTAQNPATFKLLANCAEMIKFTSGYVVLDLAGYDIQGTDEQAFSVVCQGAHMIVTNSVPATGAVKRPVENEDAAGAMQVKGDDGAVAVYVTKFDDIIKIAPDSVEKTAIFAIYSGTFIDEDADNDPDEFAYNVYVQNGATVTSLGNNYFQVGGGAQPIGTYTVTVTTNENATYAAVYKDGGATITPANNVLTVTVGQTIVITATPNSGYEYATTPDGWTAGQDGEITIEVSVAGTVAIPAPTAQTLDTYTVTVIPTNNTTYAAAYNDGGAAVEFVNDVAAVTVGKTITITATPGSGYEYAETPTGWTAGQDGKITIEVSAEATVAIPGPTEKSSYPSYIDTTDDTIKGKYDAWAQTYGADTGSAYEAAFLLNVDPDTGDTTLDATNIVISGTTVTITIDHEGVNGYPYVLQAATLDGLKTATPTPATIGAGGVITLTSSAAAQFFKVGVSATPIAVP